MSVSGKAATDKFKELAAANPRMASVRAMILRDATREHIALRAVPGYKVRGKVTSILQKQLGGPAKLEMPSSPILADNVDLTCYSELPPSMRSGAQKLRSVTDTSDDAGAEGVSEVGAAVSRFKYSAVLRAVQSECLNLQLNELTTASVLNYVSSERERVLIALEDLYTTKKAAHDHDVMMRDRRRIVKHTHVFVDRVASDDKRRAAFPANVLQSYERQIIRCANGGTAFDRQTVGASTQRSVTPVQAKAAVSLAADGTLHRDALVARVAGLTESELRGLECLDDGMRLLPLLPRVAMIRRDSVPHEQPPSPRSTSALHATVVTPSNLGSFLQLGSEGTAQSPSTPPNGSLKLDHVLDGGRTAPSVGSRMRFDLDAATLAGLLNNDGALLVAMIRIMDKHIGSLGSIGAFSDVDQRFYATIAQRRASVKPRVVSGKSTVTVERNDELRPMAAPLPLLTPDEVSLLLKRSEDAVETPDQSMPSLAVTALQLARDPAIAAKIDRIPPGVVGQVLRALPLQTLSELATLWTVPVGAEGLDDARAKLGLGPDATPSVGAPTGDGATYEPSCLICAASMTGKHQDSMTYTLEEVRSSWRSLQQVSNVSANAKLVRMLDARHKAKTLVTAEPTGTTVSGVIKKALSHGLEWSLSRGLSPAATAALNRLDQPPRAASTDPSSFAAPSAAVPSARSPSPPRSRTPTASPLWEAPQRDITREEACVAQVERFWTRLGVFLRTVGMPVGPEHTQALETLRVLLLRERAVSAATLFRWFTMCGPSAVEGREMAKLVMWLSIELGVPQATITQWRKLPSQRAAGWSAVGGTG